MRILRNQYFGEQHGIDAKYEIREKWSANHFQKITRAFTRIIACGVSYDESAYNISRLRSIQHPPRHSVLQKSLGWSESVRTNEFYQDTLLTLLYGDCCISFASNQFDWISDDHKSQMLHSQQTYFSADHWPEKVVIMGRRLKIGGRAIHGPFEPQYELIFGGNSRTDTSVVTFLKTASSSPRYPLGDSYNRVMCLEYVRNLVSDKTFFEVQAIL